MYGKKKITHFRRKRSAEDRRRIWVVLTQKVRTKTMYEFRNVRGHVEVYDNRGQFLFSADNEKEAREELEEG